VRNFEYSNVHLDFVPHGVNIINLFAGGNDDPILGSEFDFDVVWICRTHNFAKYGMMANKAKLVNSDLKVIFDTEALATDRDIIFRRLNHLPLPHDPDFRLRDELQLELRPDAYVVVSDADKSRIEEVGTVVETSVLGHGMALEEGVRKGRRGRAGIAFYGAFFSKESPNYDSLEWFLENVWPILIANNKDLEFYVAGPTGIDVDLDELCSRYVNVQYLGVVENLSEDLLDHSLVAVAPTRFAAGIPHKVHTALASGIPCVCTDLLALQIKPTEMKLSDVPVLSSSCDDPQKFAENCEKLLGDKKLWESYQKKGLSFIKNYHSQGDFEEGVRRLLTSLS
jgi:glycosyltransferase involved in cell wall biosynthesis